MSAVALATRQSLTRISQLRRDENDRVYWEPVDTVDAAEPPNVALTCWLLEEEPLPGTYRAERDGGRAEQRWTGAE